MSSSPSPIGKKLTKGESSNTTISSQQNIGKISATDSIPRPKQDKFDANKTQPLVEPSPSSKKSKYPTEWARTIQAEQRLKNADLQGHAVIGHDRRISGGVYAGANEGREIISVESPWQKNGHLEIMYSKALSSATVNGVVKRGFLLKAVYNIVSANFFPYKRNSSAVRQVMKENNIEPEQIISIEKFLSAKAGVCRHMAIACAALVERACDDGYLRGKVSIDRNTRTDHAAHAWCRYTSKSGIVFILDVMHGVSKSLLETKNTTMWNYFRPDDLK